MQTQLDAPTCQRQRFRFPDSGEWHLIAVEGGREAALAAEMPGGWIPMIQEHRLLRNGHRGGVQREQRRWVECPLWPWYVWQRGDPRGIFDARGHNRPGVIEAIPIARSHQPLVATALRYIARSCEVNPRGVFRADPQCELAAGVEVRITGGTLAGMTGVVERLDPSRVERVWISVGKMSAGVSVERCFIEPI